LDSERGGRALVAAGNRRLPLLQRVGLGMSFAQDEITAQINAIKGEWRQTVSSLDSNADAPSGLTRPEFKEVARVQNVSCNARPPAPPARDRCAVQLTSRCRLRSGGN